MSLRPALLASLNISGALPCTNSAPISIGAVNCESECVWMRPPIRSRASKTIMSKFAELSSHAAASPAAPAPMIKISVSSAIPFLIAAIALARLHLGLRVFAYVLAQRSTDVFNLFETTVRIASHVTLVVSGIDQFAFAVMFLIRHFATPPLRISCAEQQTRGHKETAKRSRDRCAFLRLSYYSPTPLNDFRSAVRAA